MPLYTYECPACDARKTLLRKIDDRNEPVACDSHECDGRVMERTLGMPAVHYNAHGFTRTPAIMKDPIAQGPGGVAEKQRNTNWGTASSSEYGGYTDISE